MGLGTKGTIFIFDDDEVSEANLMGQLLFDAEHVKKQTPKVQAAKQKINQLGHRLKVTPHVMKVQYQNEKNFFETFKNANCIISAVDNNDARAYLEELAYRVTIQNGTPLVMLEGGIGGTRGTGVVSVPFQSGTYVEKAGKGKADPTQIKCLPSDLYPKTSTEVIRKSAEIFELIFYLQVFMVNEAVRMEPVSETGQKLMDLYLPLQTVDPAEWALLLFENLCFERQEETIAKYKKKENELLGQATLSGDEQAALKVVKNPPSSIKFNPANGDHEALVNSIKPLGELIKGTPFKGIKFDKDNETHLEFVYRLSLILCDLFRITRQDREYVRRVAGNIITAIITSTELVSATISLNLINVICGQYDALREPMFDSGRAKYTLAYGVDPPAPIERPSEGPSIYPYERMNFSLDRSMCELVEEIEVRFGIKLTKIMAYPVTLSWDQSEVAKPRHTLVDDKGRQTTFGDWLGTIDKYCINKPKELMLGVVAEYSQVFFRLIISPKNALSLWKPIRLCNNNKGICFYNTALQSLLSCRTWMEQLRQRPCLATRPVTFAFQQYLWGDINNIQLYDRLSECLPHAILPFPEDGYKDPVLVLSTIEQAFVKENQKEIFKEIGFHLQTRKRCLECGYLSEWEYDDFCFHINRYLFVNKSHGKHLNPQSFLHKTFPLEECPQCSAEVLKTEQSIVGENEYLIFAIEDPARIMTVVPDPYLAVPQNDTTVFYELIGLSYWTGGHHFGYSKMPKDDEWVCLNDSTFSAVEIPTLFQEKNKLKLLTYRRCQDQKPELFKTLQIRFEGFQNEQQYQVTYRTDRTISQLHRLIEIVFRLPRTFVCNALESSPSISALCSDTVLTFAHTKVPF